MRYMARGRFISLEGGEGCGKSTQTRLLAEALKASGREILLVREPGGTQLGEKARAILKDNIGEAPCDRAELFLFLAARAQLVENVIKPALKGGLWVLSDRFYDSTIAYQGYGRGMPLEYVKAANDFACDGIMPDITILLDLDVETASRRMRSREEKTNTTADRIERAGMEFHSRLRQGFLEIARREPDRVVVVNADRSPEEVFANIFEYCKKMF